MPRHANRTARLLTAALAVFLFVTVPALAGPTPSDVKAQDWQAIRTLLPKAVTLPALNSTLAGVVDANDYRLGDQVGNAVDADGDRVVVGARYKDAPEEDNGQVYVFRKTNGTWAEEGRFSRPGKWWQNDESGVAVAISGDTVAFSQYASGSGRVWIQTFVDGEWLYQADFYITADPYTRRKLGWALDLEGDTLLVSAAEDEDRGIDAGAAYVYTRTGTAWSQLAKLHGSDTTTGDEFGFSVSLDASATTAAIGSRYHGGTGAVYVFSNAGGIWTETAKIVASDVATSDQFGRSVALDGSTLAVGSPFDDDLGTASGSVYVYTGAGATWNQVAKLTASDGSSGDWLGYTLDAEGGRVIASAHRDDDAGTSSGAAYVFDGTNGWSERKLKASNAAGGDEFGSAVALSATDAFTGAPLADPVLDGRTITDRGTVYAYNLSNTAEAEITASEPIAHDVFGVDMVTDGQTLAISSQWDNDDPCFVCAMNGSVTIYTRNAAGGGWDVEQKIHSPGGKTFGWSIDMDGDTLIVGQSSAQKAHVYTRSSGGTWTLEATLTGTSSNFGRNVQVEGDTAVVHGGTTLYVYTRSAGIWTKTDVLVGAVGTYGQVDMDGGTVVHDGKVFTVSGGTIALTQALTHTGYSAIDGDRLMVAGAIYDRDAAGVFNHTATLPNFPTSTSSSGATNVDIQGDYAAAGIMRRSHVDLWQLTENGWEQTTLTSNAPRSSSTFDDADSTVVFGGNTFAAMGWGFVKVYDLVSPPVPPPVTPMADLVVEPGATLDATEVLVEGTVNVTYQLRNVGDGVAAGGFRDNIYLSADATLDAGDVLVRQSFLHSVDVAPGAATSLHTRDVTIPYGTAAGSYFLIVQADGDLLVEESNEDNNTVALGLAVIENTVTLPDLVVYNNDVALSSAFAEPGATIDATFRIKNVGTVTSEIDFRDSIYLSADTVLDAGDVFLQYSYLHNVPIPPGYRTSEHTRTLQVPADTAFGTYYILVVADGDNAVPETDETNNLAASVAFEIGTSMKDLQVQNVSLPTTTLSTIRAVTVSWETVNVGMGTVTEDWREVISLSTDATPDPSDMTLRYSITHTNDLAGGGVRPDSREVVIPRVAPGDYYMIVWADSELLVGEYAEENNWEAIAVTIYEGTGLPDFIVGAASLSSTVVASGTSVDVSYTITNVGEAASVDPFRNTFYLSTDDVLDAGDTFLRDSMRHTFWLPEIDGMIDGMREVVIPTGTTAGEYFLIVAADGDGLEAVAESNENNNTMALPVTITGGDGDPDMTVDKVRLSTYDAGMGEMVEVIYEVVNPGSLAVDQDWIDGIYLSADPVLDAGDTFLSFSHRHTFNLAPAGGRHGHIEDVVIPTGLEVGTYYILVQADDENIVNETDESNNVGVISLRIWADGMDFVVNDLALAAPEVNAGMAVRLDHTVLNQGIVNVTGPWYDAIYLSSDETLDAGDTLLRMTHRHQADVFAYGGTHGHGRDIPVPSTTVPGDYFMIVEADGELDILESNEANNTASIAITVLPFMGLPDLTPELMSVSDTMLYPGQGVTVTYDTANIGAGDAITDHWDRYYLSADDVLDSGDVLLGHSLRLEEDVLAGGRVARSRQVQIPYSTAGGDYFLITKVDGILLIEEEDEDNNVAMIAVSVTPGSGKADLVIDNATTDAYGVAGLPMTVNYNSVNVGDGNMSMNHQDGFYLSTDTVLDAYDTRLVISDVHTTDLSPIASENRTQVVRIPDAAMSPINPPPGTVVPGPHFILIVADDVDTELEIVPSHNRVEEISEDNNMVAVPVDIWAQGVDLVVTAVSVDNVNASRGDHVNVTYTVVNQGVETTNVNYWDSFYLSFDDLVDETDYLVGDSYFEWAAVEGFGGTYTATVEVLLPLEMESSDDYVMLVDTDGHREVTESNEDNNTNTAAQSVGACATEEVCGDGIDNNCDGQVDEGCVACPCWTTADLERAMAAFDWTHTNCFDWDQGGYDYDFSVETMVIFKNATSVGPSTTYEIFDAYKDSPNQCEYRYRYTATGATGGVYQEGLTEDELTACRDTLKNFVRASEVSFPTYSDPETSCYN